MFMNLHTLPAGVHMYTLFIAEMYDGEVEVVDEYDVKAAANAQSKDVIAAAVAEWDGMYDLTRQFVGGVVDQSTGTVIFRDDRLPR